MDSIAARVARGIIVEEEAKQRARDQLVVRMRSASAASKGREILVYERLGASRSAGARAAGLSVYSYQQASRVLRLAAQDPSKYGDLVAMLDERGGLARAAREVLARQGAAIRHVVHNGQRNANTLVELRRAVGMLDGIVLAVKDVETSGLTDQEAAEIHAGLVRTISALNSLRRKCGRKNQ